MIKFFLFSCCLCDRYIPFVKVYFSFACGAVNEHMKKYLMYLLLNVVEALKPFLKNWKNFKPNFGTISVVSKIPI
jgi:hypothetical protein